MNLRYAFGTGETIAANWQQIQVQSPRLNLAYIQPYVFQSAFGLDTYFDFLRKDSSFLNLSARLGLQYLVTARQTGKLFFQQQSTNLLTVDTALIKSTKRLPVYLDVTNSQLGVDYQFAGTDYRNNPRKGMEASLTFSGGVRRIRENGAITGLKEDASGKPFDFSSLYDTIDQKQYLIRVKASLTRYFMTSRQSTLKFSLQGGSIFSRDLFRNELFQIGGYRLLRGFDEESIFAKAYGVGTLEYRYLIGLNSFLFAFTDIGFAGVSDHTDPHNHRIMITRLDQSEEPLADTVTGLSAEFWIRDVSDTTMVTTVRMALHHLIDATDAERRTFSLWSTSSTSDTAVWALKPVSGGMQYLPGTHVVDADLLPALQLLPSQPLRLRVGVEGGPTSVLSNTRDVIQLRPQPTTEVLRVLWPDHPIQELSIVDLHGRPMTTIAWSSVPDGAMVDVRHLPTGVYLMRVDGRNLPVSVVM
jgi:hypothetical protein